MADDHGRATQLADELREHPVDLVGGRGVELAGRLVGEKQPWPVGDCRAERDALLLAAGELGRLPVPLLCQADAIEELVGPPQPIRPRRSVQAELERHELACTELGRERACIVLVGVAEERRAVRREPPIGKLADVLSVDANDAR